MTTLTLPAYPVPGREYLIWNTNDKDTIVIAGCSAIQTLEPGASISLKYNGELWELNPGKD